VAAKSRVVTVVFTRNHLLVGIDRSTGIVPGMRTIAQGSMLALVAALAVTGCGSSRPVRSAAAVADCLNGENYLVSVHGNRVEGSTEAGVTFTLVVRSGRPSSVTTAGDPHAATLSIGAHAVVADCLRKHGPQPGTLTPPAAR
jgi:hypothetical protein